MRKVTALGEIALIDNKPRSATVKTVKTYTISEDHETRLLQRYGTGTTNW